MAGYYESDEKNKQVIFLSSHVEETVVTRFFSSRNGHKIVKMEGVSVEESRGQP